MSYHFAMSFARADSELDAFRLCAGKAEALTDPATARTYLREALEMFPEYCVCHGLEPDSPGFQAFLREYVRNLFLMRFVYWPQYGLLGQVGEYPEPARLGGARPVWFQDSTDQDYRFDTWDEGIPFFRACRDRAAAMTAQELLDARDMDAEAAGDPEALEYARRTILYSSIFRTLDLNNWVYGGDGQFRRINISGIGSQEKLYSLADVGQSVLRRSSRASR